MLHDAHRQQSLQNNTPVHTVVVMVGHFSRSSKLGQRFQAPNSTTNKDVAWQARNGHS